jgi:hypothetical protein
VYPDGTKSIVWPPGLHFPYPPSVRVSHLVTQQAIVVGLPVEQCQTKDNFTVNVNSALTIRIMGDAEHGEDPNLVMKFVHELNPRGLDEQLRTAHADALKRLARSKKYAEICGMGCGGNRKRNQQRVTEASLGAIQRVAEEEIQSAASDGLGSWVAMQRKEYKLLMEGKPSRLTHERIRRLENIGFEWVEGQGRDDSSHPTFSDRLKQRLNGQFM